MLCLVTRCVKELAALAQNRSGNESSRRVLESLLLFGRECRVMFSCAPQSLAALRKTVRCFSSYAKTPPRPDHSTKSRIRRNSRRLVPRNSIPNPWRTIATSGASCTMPACRARLRHGRAASSACLRRSRPRRLGHRAEYRGRRRPNALRIRLEDSSPPRKRGSRTTDQS